ncbi:heavy metal translocating P-type ATPase [Pelagibaculum spongiae]|uniref:Heavy metal translocating P-type ATPase n=1 Tax=Pelagibaculum spongiae TaxID=2080658 RepID=A0A2V1H3B7_9GAMM|nr:heavy metal translocating P-type ATPase [Pelagibaculum spongiae]PVZ70499.1 heavy metal translocating P-type ATPase [Pelagibaculum spongiae]
MPKPEVSLDYATQTAKNCFHCGSPNPKQPIIVKIEDQPRAFCCHGCSAVCQAIHQSGLKGFYQRTQDGELLSPPPEPPQDTELFDLEEIQQDYLVDSKTTDNGANDQREINMLVEGIHCAACVWLIEKSLSKDGGVVEARVNLSGRRLKLRWDNSQTQLSNIIKRLSSIGYSATPFDPEQAEGQIKKANKTLLLRLGFAAFCMMNLMWVSIALFAGADDGEFRSLFHWVGFALATPCMIYSGWPFLRGGWSSIQTASLTMDLPIAIGILATWSYSSFVTFTQSTTGDVYFDTVVNFVFIILVGRYLEAISRRNAVVSSQRLMDLQPRVASVLLDDNSEQIRPVRTLSAGEKVQVKPGGRVPVDGMIVDGQAQIDESMLSGESEPVTKATGDSVFAGSQNISGSLTVQITGTLKDTALGKIIALVEEAQSSKAPIQMLADKIVPWFVAVTLLLSLSTFAFWLFSGNMTAAEVEFALLASVSVLIITCPCAFGLATPMAVAVASGLGAKNGILIKHGAALEYLASADEIIFDKTGTLTCGEPKLDQFIVADGVDKPTLLTKAGLLESRSEHPLAKAVVAAASELKKSLIDVELTNFQSFQGLGVSADFKESELKIGSRKWLLQQNISLPDNMLQQAEAASQQALTDVWLVENQRVVGLMLIGDTPRSDAKSTLSQLKSAAVSVSLLSGDRQPVADAVAEKLGGMDYVIAEVLPAEKDAEIKKRQQNGKKIVMVGDGINDAPALARADVGVALASGTDVSMDCADIILSHNRLADLPLARRLSQATMTTIRQNIGLSLAYNIVLVPLAVTGQITPLFAAIAMPISSLVVIGNAARLGRVFKS